MCCSPARPAPARGCNAKGYIRRWGGGRSGRARRRRADVEARRIERITRREGRRQCREDSDAR